VGLNKLHCLVMEALARVCEGHELNMSLISNDKQCVTFSLSSHQMCFFVILHSVVLCDSLLLCSASLLSCLSKTYNKDIVDNDIFLLALLPVTKN